MMTRAIGAHELTEAHTLIGDALCPTRFGTGVPVLAVNDDLSDRVLVVAGRHDMEYLPGETVYVAR